MAAGGDGVVAGGAGAMGSGELAEAAEAAVHTTHRTLFERGTGARTQLAMTTTPAGRTSFTIGQPEEAGGGRRPRAWVVRVHLPPAARVVEAAIDGQPTDEFVHLAPLAQAEAAAHLPFGGRVSRPFPSWNRSILTEMYLCHACSYPELEDPWKY
jgi:hypothetical protein